MSWRIILQLIADRWTVLLKALATEHPLVALPHIMLDTYLVLRNENVKLSRAESVGSNAGLGLLCSNTTDDTRITIIQPALANF